MAVVRVLSSYVDRVTVANPMQVKAIAYARIKTDKNNAGVLAQLHASGFLAGGLVPDERTERLRRRRPAQPGRRLEPCSTPSMSGLETSQPDVAPSHWPALTASRHARTGNPVGRGEETAHLKPNKTHRSRKSRNHACRWHPWTRDVCGADAAVGRRLASALWHLCQPVRRG